MPVILREFNYRRILEHKKKEEDLINKASKNKLKNKKS